MHHSHMDGYMAQQPTGHMVQPTGYAPHTTVEPQDHNKYMHDTCINLHLHLVQLQTIDGQMIDGIIEQVDNEGVTMLLPAGETDDHQYDNSRQFGVGVGGFGGGYGPAYGGYGPGYGPGFGYGAGFGYGFPRRFRRFRRRRFPFFGLRRLFFPFFF